MPPKVKESAAAVPETVSVSVIVVASVIATAALLISRPAVKLTLGLTAVLNSKPSGAFSTRVTPEPAAKSLLAPSVRVIAPSVVHSGAGAFAAVSADRPLPPLAPVTLTAAKLLAPLLRTKPITKTRVH